MLLLRRLFVIKPLPDSWRHLRLLFFAHKSHEREQQQERLSDAPSFRWQWKGETGVAVILNIYDDINNGLNVRERRAEEVVVGVCV